MANEIKREPMLDLFIIESLQLIDQLEQCILDSEKTKSFGSNAINEIFRIMHTIKGAAAMMLFTNIATLAHSVEDLFYFLREQKPKNVNYSKLIDVVLETVDFTKNEIFKIEQGHIADGDSSKLRETSVEILSEYKRIIQNNNGVIIDEPKEVEPDEQKFYIGSYKLAAGEQEIIYKITIYFEEGCEMENIRAFSVVHSLKEKSEILEFFPHDIIENEASIEIIRERGFELTVSSNIQQTELEEILAETVFVHSICIEKIENYVRVSKPKTINLDDEVKDRELKKEEISLEKETITSVARQSVISVNLVKLDKLMDLVGELVISESMVTRNPEIENLQLDNFYKAARQLRKITAELQDVVMSIRMVPLSGTFQKMNRIVRDMSKKLSKNVELVIIGEETEVDKNIIENISDPLMHLIRNSLDHGIEAIEDRIMVGKSETGKIVLEAKNSGGDVLISIKDDGKGLDKEKILKKAKENGLVNKSDNELTDSDIYSFVFMPGFSTKEKVTEFSGRGVGMDVVVKNIEKVNGTVSVDSVAGKGSVFTIKIPLTLAIIDGMIVRVGDSSYTIPTISIKESFRPKENDLITDPDGNEMMLIRGECFPVLRIYKHYGIQTKITNMYEGIIVMVEDERRGVCLFVDALVGEQQVVVKSLPKYIKKIHGLSGCTMLGDGSISLILDTGALINISK